MEEEAPSRPSVAELAGRFKDSVSPHNASGNETDKPVRRRPPRSLHLPKPQEDHQEPPGVTSPLPTKAKRNSALIEKLQANLALSPTALLPSPKSPGFRLLPPSFTVPSPSSGPETTVTTSSTSTPTSPVVITPLTEEEGPTSFEDPPTTAEGSILPCINKGRARHSIRRRPPSRRHRKSSSGEEVGGANEGEDSGIKDEPDDMATEQVGAGGGEGGEVFCDGGQTELEDREADNNGSHREDEMESGMELQGEDKEKKEEEEEDGESQKGGEEEKTEDEVQEGSSGGKQEDQMNSKEDQKSDS
ncbi:duboraya [Aulostomus maculatus]